MEAYQLYGRALRRKAARIIGNDADAGDIVQALFVELLQRPELPLDLPYLYRAVTNRCLTMLRDESNRTRLLEPEQLPMPAPRTLCDERAISGDLLRKLVRRLDDEHCHVLTCRFIDDMTQEEIAQQLGLSRKTIGHRLDAIRAAVNELSAQNGGAA
jgi:RNA polymerase sigma-70 factor (ECF subfamily)